MRTVAAWTLVIVLLLCVFAGTSIALWPFVAIVTLYAWSVIPAIRIERQMRKELQVMLDGRTTP